MKININKILLLTVNCLFLNLISCTLVDLEGPLKGKTTLVTDWSKRTAGIEQPANYVITINNQTLIFNNNSNALPELAAGIYPIHIYNTPDKISISGTSATVATTISNTVDPLPGWLFTATSEAVYTDLKDETVTVVMQQQVRQLTLILKPEDASGTNIMGITAKLSGVCGIWNFETNQPQGTIMDVPLIFVKQVDGSWQATVRLLGMIGSQQKLTGTIMFDNGMPADIPLDSNLSSQLTNFNSNKYQPISLTGTIQETLTDAGFVATINQWQTGTNSGGVAQ